jgi:hypothetical protein
MFQARYRTALLIATFLFSLYPNLWAARSVEVFLDTSGLASNVYQANFQLIGDGLGSAALHSFQLGGGQVLGTPTSIGGVSGDLNSTVLFSTESSFFNDFTQSFRAASFFRFQIVFDLMPAPSPITFSFALLSEEGSEIPTRSPFNAFLIASLDQNDSLAIRAFDSLDGVVPAPFVSINESSTDIPEPSTVWLSSCAVALLVLAREYQSCRKS